MERKPRELLRENMKRIANQTRDTADQMASMFDGCDDPMHPWKILEAPFHSWVEFVDQVCRPLLDAEEEGDHAKVQEAMRLFRMTNPHYLASCLVLAANKSKSEGKL